VFGELSRQSAAHPEQVDLYHLRDKDGYEVDLVLQLNNSFAGIEVKAASTVTPADFRGLRRMREIVGARFSCGVVLYDGEHVLPFGEGMLAVPLSALWCTRAK
jgi:predicted AAA+ superfamily ATPase